MAGRVGSLIVLGWVVAWAGGPVRGDTPHSRASSENAGRKAVRADRYGDPLPDGAITRIGTTRLRHPSEVEWVSFTPDGKTVISGSFGVGTLARRARAVCFWDVTTGRLAREVGDQCGGHPMAVTRDGRLSATCYGTDGTVRLWDLATGRMVRELHCRGRAPDIEWLAFSPDGTLLTTCGFGSPLDLWDVRTGKRLHRLARDNEGRSAAFSADGRRLASVGGDGVEVWDVATGRRLLRVPGWTAGRYGLAFSPDRRLLAVGGADEPIQLWHIPSGRRGPTLGGPDSELIDAVAFSPDGRLLAAVGSGQTLRCWDAGTGKLARRWRVSQDARAVAFSPDGKTLACGDAERVRLWDVRTGKERFPVREHQGAVHTVAFSPDGRLLASGSVDGTIRLWTPITGQARRVLTGIGDTRGLAFMPGGQTLLSVDVLHTVQAWDLSRGKRTGEYPTAEGKLDVAIGMATSADGRRLAWEAGTSTLRVWDNASRRLVCTVRQPAQCWQARVALSADGRLVASGGEGTGDGPVVVREVGTGKPVARLPAAGWVGALAFAPDAKHLAVACEQPNSLRLWEIASGKQTVLPRSGEGAIDTLTFSRDGRLLAAGTDDMAVHWWEVVSGRQVGTLLGHGAEVTSIAFAPDGRALASGSKDSTVVVWDVTGLPAPSRQPLSVPAPARLGRLWLNLTSLDARKAQRAVWMLTAGGGEAIAFIKGRVRPVSPAPPGQIAVLVAELDSPRFAVRERATRELAELTERAAAALRVVLSGGPQPEVRRRVTALLDDLDEPVRSGELLRELRAVQILEQVGSPAARRVLERLARGAAGARLTREAKAALARLGKRTAPVLHGP